MIKTINYNPETHVLVPKGMMYELPELPMPIKGKFSKDLFDGVQMHQYAMRYLDEAIAAAPQPYRVTTKESYVELDIHSNPSRTEQQRKLDGSLEVGQLLGNGQNQETSHSKTVGDVILTDTFRGDDSALIESIVALVSLDRAGVLVPHGIGGHARSLLESAAIRLSQPDRTAELEAALKVARDALEHYAPMIKQGESPAEEAIVKIDEVLK